jgi:hypothetical protein
LQKQDISEIKKIFIVKNSKFKCKQVFCYFFKKSEKLNTQEKYYYKLKKSLKEKLDIFTVVSVLEDINKIKQIIFDNYQLLILKYIKESVSIPPRELVIENVIDTYKFLQNRGNEIDKKLLNMFNELLK